MIDERVPGVVKVSRADAIKIAVAVEADERMGIKSDDWMVQIAKLVEPSHFGTKKFAPQFKTVQAKNAPTEGTYREDSDEDADQALDEDGPIEDAPTDPQSDFYRSLNISPSASLKILRTPIERIS